MFCRPEFGIRIRKLPPVWGRREGDKHAQWSSSAEQNDQGSFVGTIYNDFIIVALDIYSEMKFVIQFYAYLVLRYARWDGNGHKFPENLVLVLA